MISLVPATNQREHVENILHEGKHQALNALSLYGPNGGGKSNLLKAMSLLDKLVNRSARSNSTTKLPYDPFLLKEGSAQKPTQFEISFIINEERYRYGVDFNETHIVNEWLFRKSVGREVIVFEREFDVIDVSSGFRGSKSLINAAIEATRDNALFLSTCDILNIEEAKMIMQWFAGFTMLDGLTTEDDLNLNTVSLYNSAEYEQKIRDYLTNIGVSLFDIQITERDNDDIGHRQGDRRTFFKYLKGEFKDYQVNAVHKIYNKKGEFSGDTYHWDFYERESAGTQKAFKMSGPILWALINGNVLIIDEIEAAMHPIMTLKTIELFLNKENNPNNAQLIFATHDTNLLSYSTLRRDQICFAQKNKWESTELYSLSDFVYFEEKDGEFRSEKERPDTDKEKRYFEGRYGAIPALGEFLQTIKTKKWLEEEK
ncbi:RloA [Chryseobacterium sp. FH1]|nr:RloA [Chryseobacterium sp. FH1]